MTYERKGPIPRAALVRETLKAAGLIGRVERVTSGTRTTYVYLHCPDVNDDTPATQVAEALHPLWTDGQDRVHVLMPWVITIGRDALVRAA